GPGTPAKEKEEGWKPVLDDATAKELIKRSVERIKEALQKPPADAKKIRVMRKKIQVAGVMIAVYAQSVQGGANKQELAAFRDAALKLSKAAADKDVGINEVKKLAEALAAAKADPGAKGDFIPLKAYLDDNDDVMFSFKRLALGGDGLPKTLQTN